MWHVLHNLILFVPAPSSPFAIPYPLSTHIQVLVRLTNRFPTPPIKLKLGLQVGGRLLIATHLDQSNYIAVHFFMVPSVFQWIHWIWLMNLTHPRFLVQGHILNVGGDALTTLRPYINVLIPWVLLWGKNWSAAVFIFTAALALKRLKKVTFWVWS